MLMKRGLYSYPDAAGGLEGWKLEEEKSLDKKMQGWKTIGIFQKEKKGIGDSLKAGVVALHL